MSIEERNIRIKKYIIDISNKLNYRYRNIIDNEKLERAIEKFTSSSDSYDEIEEEIDEEISKLIEEYITIKEKQEAILQAQSEMYGVNNRALTDEKSLIEIVDISDLTFEELNKLYYHYSLKKDKESIEKDGLIAKIGRNSKDADKEIAIYFSSQVEGVLETWDVWLKWRFFRLYSPQWDPENKEVIAKIEANQATEEEKRFYFYKLNKWNEVFLTGRYKQDKQKVEFLFDFQLDEMMASNYYSLDLKEGEEFTFDEIDKKKEKSIQLKNTKDDLAYQYYLTIWGEYTSQESLKVDKWNMNTILGKKLTIEPQRIKQLVTQDGKSDVFSVVNYLYNQYKENIPEDKQVKFDLLDNYIKYCTEKTDSKQSQSTAEVKETEKFGWKDSREKVKYDLIKLKNEVKTINPIGQNVNNNEKEDEKPKVKVKTEFNGFTNALLLALITGFASGVIFVLTFMIFS